MQENPYDPKKLDPLASGVAKDPESYNLRVFWTKRVITRVS